MSGHSVKPPRLGRLLLRLCRLGDRRDDVRADMQELFERRVATAGVREARRRFMGDVMSLVAPSPKSLTSGLRTDLRDATRALARTPLQTASLYLCLLLGTSLTVVMFTLVNAIFTGNLPGIVDRSSLYRLTTVQVDQQGQPTGDRGGLSMQHVQSLPPRLAGTVGTAVQIRSVFGSASVHSTPTRVVGQFVNGDYFSVLGTAPVRGRLLQPSDDSTTAPPVLVIGFDFWMRHFAGRDDALGRTIGVGPHSPTIVGILPRGFAGIGDLHVDELGGGATDAGDIWLPTALATWGRDALVAGSASRGVIGGKVVVRLAPNATEADIQRALLPIAATLDAEAKEYKASRPDSRGLALFAGFDIEPFRLTEEGTNAAELVGGVALLMTVPVLVLLIACTNVAGVQLSRALRRTHELATRVALGATRFQLARLIALETGVIALAAGLSAWFITLQAVRWADGLLPMGLMADWRVFVVAMGVPAVVTVIAGLLPSWRATGFRVLDGLQQGAGAGMSARVTRTRRVALAIQIALCVALMGTALHLSRAVAAVPDSLAPRQDDVLVVSLRMADIGMTKDEEDAAWRVLADRLPALPGVTIVGFGEGLFSQTNWGSSGWVKNVTADWFPAIGATVLAGRLPRPAESDVVVVNETLAATLGGLGAAVGKVVKARTSMTSRQVAEATVVGVVADGYERVAWNRRVPVGYRVVDPATTMAGDTMFLKGPGAAEARRDVLELLGTIHPQLAPWEVGTVAEHVDGRFAAARLSINALAAMSVSALVLAAVGLFGAMAQSASSRLREFGVRLALGARPADIGRLIVREAAMICGAGLVLGLASATWLAFAVRSILETMTPFDPVPPLAIGVSVFVIATFAALMPARRVMAIDPVKTLRGE